ncbi:MAG: hypothetical protein IMF11_06800 [Proteobacteria bacterium]|nr:hypothetical protein [Pseudomonadota bacterium]
METLLRAAMKFLDENMGINEVELSDGINRVKVVRYAPTIQYYTTPPSYPYAPYQY